MYVYVPANQPRPLQASTITIHFLQTKPDKPKHKHETETRQQHEKFRTVDSKSGRLCVYLPQLLGITTTGFLER